VLWRPGKVYDGHLKKNECRLMPGSIPGFLFFLSCFLFYAHLGTCKEKAVGYRERRRTVEKVGGEQGSELQEGS
jgi:hypothetical protein